MPMSPPRFYCQVIEGKLVELSASESRHLSLVRRIPPGQQVELFDGKGTLAQAVVEKAESSRTILRIERIETFQPRREARITIAPSIAKGQRFDWLIAKCTELGVDRIFPIIFERTVKKAKNPATLVRWENIAIESAKQSRRLFLPQIDAPSPLPVAVENLKTAFPQARFLVGSISSDARKDHRPQRLWAIPPHRHRLENRDGCTGIRGNTCRR